MRKACFGFFLLTLSCAAPASPTDGAVLRAHLQKTYPSLAYVERYRQTFPGELQGDASLWSASAAPPRIESGAMLVDALLGLQDQHVALSGPDAGLTESLGVLFRTSTDSSMVVWKVVNPALSGLTPGDAVLAIDDVPTAAWLKRAAEKTFGGNRRSRVAEAALQLGLGTQIAHKTAGLGSSVILLIKSGTNDARKVVLPYLPMSPDGAIAMTKAINRPDLPEVVAVDGYRVGTLRLGAFAPQYDPVFLSASDAVEKTQGATRDQAMLAGFCAVVREFVAKVNDINRQSDILLVDLRGNFGGFGRSARLLADSLTSASLPESFDVFAGEEAGSLLLKKQPADPSCGKVGTERPMIVLTDAGTRSAGEFMATWLWGAGAIVVGERTIGAGGGRDANGKGFALSHLKYNVKASGNFTFFDSSRTLREGSAPERPLIDLVAQDNFSPSRTRPFAIQAVGLRPDLDMPSTLDDLRDGGLAQVKEAVRTLKRRKLL